ncbi:Flagellar cap protein [Thiorhodovibrio winogradskyi]|uniref:Flagellar hook-associated protein 2 n=1 Tax=Thiorhodovibrio winogradskyi TaxID=77007 RepID=A0ABZ0SD75_9GAMM|nr:flagellar filament capping protein FliD [Thiorhodovibrio winogradskyi]
MATITSTGLGSGVEVNSIVPQLVAAERKPTETRLDRQEAELQAKVSTWGTIKSAFSEFQNSLSALKLPNTFQKVAASSSDEGALGVSAAANADVGRYAIEVEKLAQNHTLASMRFSDPTDTVGSGTLTLKFGTTDYDAGTDTYNDFTQNPDSSTATIIIDSSNNTLNGLRDAINEAGIGVQASIINDGDGYRLVMNTEDGGADNSLQISVADSDGNHTDTTGLSALAFNASATNMDQTLAAQDAEMLINGLRVTSDSNTVTSALKGVTLNLNAAQDGKVIQVNLSKDSSAATSALENFITKFNELNDTVSSAADYDPATGVGGILQSDALVRGAMSQVRMQLMSAVEGLNGSVRSLVDIGIRTQADGTLKFDSDKFKSAMQADPTGVAGLFASQGTTSDSGIRYQASTADTQVGSYAVEITQMATQGRFEGGTLLSTVVDASNDSFKINVDGTESGAITLTQGTYTTAELVAELQTRINGDSALSAAGVSVDVSFNAGDNRLEMTSKQYGAVAGIALLDVEGSGLGLDDGLGYAGQDVAGTVGGYAATGNGQALTVTEGEAKGLSVTAESGATGSRGSVNFSRGMMQGLDQILSGLLSTGGTINARTEGLQRSLSKIGEDRAALDMKMEKYEARLFQQFNAMDLVVAQFKSTSSYLTQQMTAMPYANLGNN